MREEEKGGGEEAHVSLKKFKKSQISQDDLILNEIKNFKLYLKNKKIFFFPDSKIGLFELRIRPS